MGNTSFFGSKSSWKDDVYWLLKSSCFELFGDRKCGLLFGQKADRKGIFSCFFLAFHDIPALEKYGFSCSECLILMGLLKDPRKSKTMLKDKENERKQSGAHLFRKKFKSHMNEIKKYKKRSLEVFKDQKKSMREKVTLPKRTSYNQNNLHGGGCYY